MAHQEVILGDQGQTLTLRHYSTDRTSDVHVKNLRRKLEPNPMSPVYLCTVYGVGYKIADADAP